MSGRGNQHRQQAFEELFRRPAPSSSRPNQQPPQVHHHSQQPQPQQYYSYPGSHAYPDYPPTANQNVNSYNQFGVMNQSGGGGGGGGGPQSATHSHLQGYNPPPPRTGSVASQGTAGGYRTASAGSSYFEQPTAYSNQYSTPSTTNGSIPSSYDAQQQYAAQMQAQQRAYLQQQQQIQQQQQQQAAYSQQSYYGGGGSSEDYHNSVDPITPVPPPGAAGARYSSPRSQYAPTMSSGPATASTSTSLFSRQSTSSVSSLPYSYPESISNGVEPSTPVRPRSPPRPSPGASNIVAPLPSVPGYGPPRLPDIPQGSDDFFSNQPDGMWQSQSANSRGSGGGGAGGVLTPTPYSTFGRKGSSPAAGYLADEGESIYSE